MTYLNLLNVEKLGIGESFLHKINPIIKFVLLVFTYILLFNINIYNQIFILIIIAILLLSSGFKLKNFLILFLFLLLPLFSFLILLLILNVDNLLYSLIIISLRMVSLFMPVILYSNITPLKETVYTISTILKPFSKISLSFTNLATLTASLTITYFPILINEFDRVLLVKASRGEDIKKENFINKIKIINSSLFPVLVNSFLKADQMIDAIIIRGFNKDKKRSSFTKYTLNKRDFIVLIFIIFLTIILIVK